MHIYIFKENSIAAHYGIGTYIQLLLGCLLKTSYHITVVELYAEKKFFSVEKTKVRYIYVPKSEIKNDSNYYRNVVSLLRTYISSENKNVFHLNFMSEEKLAFELRNVYPLSYIVLTVHYSICEMNRVKIRPIIVSEKRLINKYCDKVIVISKHRYEKLVYEYGVNVEKVSLIPHGIKEKCVMMNISNKMEYRSCFGLKDEKIILFVGRIDDNKGLNILMSAYAMLLERMPNVHLIVAGDNHVETALHSLKNLWGKVTFTGRMEHYELLKLYSIADIGVIPSYYEELGYVAIEMLMSGIPVIANRTSGLCDVFEDGKSGILLDLYSCERSVLASEMEHLLLNPKRLVEISINARKTYTAFFSYSLFQHNMLAFYKQFGVR